MLEIRYDTITKELTGWWASRFGNHEAKLRDRPDEAIVALDIGIPEKPLEAWLYDEAGESLQPNPDYIEPEPTVFDPPPGTGVPERLEYIEDFLGGVYTVSEPEELSP